MLVEVVQSRFSHGLHARQWDGRDVRRRLPRGRCRRRRRRGAAAAAAAAADQQQQQRPRHEPARHRLRHQTTKAQRKKVPTYLPSVPKNVPNFLFRAVTKFLCFLVFIKIHHRMMDFLKKK